MFRWYHHIATIIVRKFLTNYLCTFAMPRLKLNSLFYCKTLISFIYLLIIVIKCQFDAIGKFSYNHILYRKLKISHYLKTINFFEFNCLRIYLPILHQEWWWGNDDTYNQKKKKKCMRKMIFINFFFFFAYRM